MKIRVFALGLTIVLTLVVGCAQATPTVAPPTPTVAPPTPTTLPPTPTEVPTVVVVDDAQRTVEIIGVPERIISLAPSNTEILFALGLGDRVVGVSDWSDYPPKAREIEKVGGMPLNKEKIVSLEPDLLLAAGITSSEDIAWMEEMGLVVLVLNSIDIEGVLRDIELVGRAAGAEEGATKLVTQMRTDYEAVVSKTRGAKGLRVFIELDETLYTVAPGSFIHPLVVLAGGENIASDADNPYPQFSAEEVIARDPEVIILADAEYGVTPEAVAGRPGWEVITAVKNGAVYPIDGDIISRPGPRIVDGLEELARIIHPELFK
ncbi:MAG: ABC transporter substrate-binding protein [Anaerolineae bacterium]